MNMENLKKMKECLVSIAENQVYGNIDKVNAEELGEVMDMIKDLSEAVYYCTITESMEKQAREENWNSQPMEYYDPRYREKYNNGSMYARDGGRRPNNDRSNGMIRRYDDGQVSYSMYYDPMSTGYVYRDGMMQDSHYPMSRDPKEGRSGERRKMYMEGKGYKDKTKLMQDLESYMQELATDMAEMIQDASPEEKQLLQNKIATLATKVMK